MSVIKSIATEVDRLVLAVNGAAGASAGDEIARMATSLGLSTPALLKHYAEWLLTVGITEEIVILRLPYAAEGAVAERVAEWRSLALVEDQGDGRLRATPPLRPLLHHYLDARATAAAEWWAEAPAFDAVHDAVRTVVAGIGPDLVVAHDHASVPAPERPPLALHQVLTTLRYARSASHVAAWREAGLDRDDILALSSLWQGEEATRGSLDRLVELGFVEEAGITEEGRQARTFIEAATDRMNDQRFDAVDAEALLEGLSALPSR